jgi:hypothetical protein
LKFAIHVPAASAGLTNFARFILMWFYSPPCFWAPTGTPTVWAILLAGIRRPKRQFAGLGSPDFRSLTNTLGCTGWHPLETEFAQQRPAALVGGRGATFPRIKPSFSCNANRTISGSAAAQPGIS